jgi:hypothetical protein
VAGHGGEPSERRVDPREAVAETQAALRPAENLVLPGDVQLGRGPEGRSHHVAALIKENRREAVIGPAS